MTTDRTRRRSALALGLVALAAALLLGLTVLGSGHPGDAPGDGAGPAPWDSPDYLNSGVLGDTDGDGRVTASEREDLAVTEASVETVRTSVTARKGADTVLLTPASDAWWRFVVDQAYGLGLSGSATPADVDWYAYTEGRAYHGLSQTNAYYSAVHVAFADTDTAVGWVEALAADGFAATASFTVRDRVVTVTPAWVDARTEPYPDVTGATLSTIETKVALWRIDFVEQANNRALEAADEVAYDAFWQRTGLADASWTATSPRPDVPWVGRLTGFDAAAVNVSDAAAVINTSTFQCHSDRACRHDDGISDAINEIYLADATGGQAGEELLAPADVPADVVLTLVTSGAFRGIVAGTGGRTGGPLADLTYLVTAGGTLTLRLNFEDPAAAAS